MSILVPSRHFHFDRLFLCLLFDLHGTPWRWESLADCTDHLPEPIPIQDVQRRIGEAEASHKPQWCLSLRRVRHNVVWRDYWSDVMEAFLVEPESHEAVPGNTEAGICTPYKSGKEERGKEENAVDELYR